MPEQISKYPDVTLKVLKGAGAVCGEGVEQKILTKCPADRFCSLKTGEICVYGISDIPQMTQITMEELASVVCPDHQGASIIPPMYSGSEVISIGMFFAIGIVIGIFSRKFKKGT